MILLLQMLLGAAVTAWHLFGGLPPLVAIPLAALGCAFLGLWRRTGKQPARPDGVNISHAPTFRSPPPSPPAMPPLCHLAGASRDRLAELELAERFSRESG